MILVFSSMQCLDKMCRFPHQEKNILHVFLHLVLAGDLVDIAAITVTQRQFAQLIHKPGFLKAPNK